MTKHHIEPELTKASTLCDKNHDLAARDGDLIEACVFEGLLARLVQFVLRFAWLHPFATP